MNRTGCELESWLQSSLPLTDTEQLYRSQEKKKVIKDNNMEQTLNKSQRFRKIYSKTW